MKTNIKTKVLLLVLLMAGGAAKAQSYESYFGVDSTRLNVYAVCTDYAPTFLLTFNKADTVSINGNIYQKGNDNTGSSYWSGGDSTPFYFREDTVMGRLYRYHLNPYFDIDKEVLLCDMSLMEGDTFTIYDEWGTTPVVVDSVFFGNDKKGKIIHLSEGDGYYNLTFYEGIWPAYNPIGIIENACPPGTYNMLCEYKDGEQVFVNPDPDYDNTCYIDDIFSVQEQNQNQIEVYPTLCSKNELINIETTDFVKDIQLFDVFGKEVSVVKNQTSENHWQMNVPNCVRGIYFVKIALKNGDYYEKIMVND